MCQEPNFRVYPKVSRISWLPVLKPACNFETLLFTLTQVTVLACLPPLAKKGTSLFVVLNQPILKVVSAGAWYKHRPLLPQFEESCLHSFDHAEPFTYKSYATSQNTGSTRGQHVPPELQSRPQLHWDGYIDWCILHICLCVYVSVCCGTQVQNINHYASALPMSLSKGNKSFCYCS